MKMNLEIYCRNASIQSIHFSC